MSSTKGSVAIITVSDRVSQGLAQDRSGPLLADQLSGDGWNVQELATVPDDIPTIQHLVERLADVDGVNLIVTTGGTGFAPRDVTPEAINPLLEKTAPGIVTAMITTSLETTPMAALSRSVCGIRKRSVIITLPGSPKGSKENLEAVLPVLAHAVELAKGDVEGADETHRKMGEVKEPPHKHRHHHHCHHHHHAHHHDHDGQKKGTAEGVRHVDVGITVPVAMRPRKSLYPLISYDAALSTVMAHADTLLPALMSIDNPRELVGSVLAEDVAAQEAVPGYRASIVDGYAVLASDGSGEYPVIAGSIAGGGSRISLQKGQIARIATGAPVPAGANAVVMVENTSLIKASDDGTVEEIVQLHETAAEGQNIREIGSDIAIGENILKQGSLITPSEIGVLASVGVTQVLAIRKPVVGLLSTGNEVVEASAAGPIPYGVIRDSNRPTLEAAVKDAGFDSIDLGIAPDSAEELAKTIRKGLDQADVLVTTGGVSMGELDLLKPVLERVLGATIHFGRVLLKPGKPTTFATIPGNDGGQRKLIFALPGNPVSASVTFYLFVLPALRKMAGYSNPILPVVRAELADHIQLDPSRPEFHRAHIAIAPSSGHQGTRLVAYSTGSQRSSRMVSMRGANALLKMAAGTQGRMEVAQGEVVDAVLIGQLG
ncbi:hypothetical protein SpCBS45565_g08304 [Spizellomyces sp. 'palustris']|nr:hypothetical protein SpCBS45565_g08304 [Spizellomyces sp. 'palustris']